MPPLLASLRAFVVRGIKKWPALDSRLQLARRRFLARGPGYPNWPGVIANSDLDWDAARSATGGKKILIATSIGSHLPAMHMETMLAAALTLRGAEVEVLLCDAVLPGCQMCEPRFFVDAASFARHGPQRDLCGHCFKPGRACYDQLGVSVRTYSDFLNADDRAKAAKTASNIALQDIAAYEEDGLKIGEHAKAGALRFYASATIDHEPEAERILRRYLEAALLTVAAAVRIFSDRRYEAAVFHHGIYVPQGLIGEVARHKRVRVVNWNPAYRKHCFLFSHHDTYHHTLMSEPVSIWEDMPWPPKRRAAIDAYLRSRWEGTNDWIRFQGNPVFEKERILAEIGCDPSRPIVACLTNVMWDAQLHYPANAFANMLDWLLHTVRYFAGRPELQLVIRVHPAELTGAVPTRQPVVAELARHFPVLPANIFIVGPESAVSTYVLADLSNAVIIYGTKTGVELSAVGIPVIVAGEAWIRGKGVTRDAGSIADYDALLNGLPLSDRLDEATIERARKYAWHFFYRRMIPLKCFEQGPGWPPYEFSAEKLDVLKPGCDAGLDCITNGILAGTPFVYDGQST